MTALSTRFVIILIYLQIDTIFKTNALTLQLQTKTTICEAIKKLDKEANKPTTDNTKISTDIAANIESPIPCQILNYETKNDQIVNQDACKSLIAMLNDLSRQNGLNNENNAVNNLNNPFLEIAKSILSEPNQVLTNVCNNSLDLPVVSGTFPTGNSKTAGIKLPISVSSTITPTKTDLTLKPCSNSVISGENNDIPTGKIDTFTSQDLIYKSVIPCNVSPFSGLKLPLSSTSNIEPSFNTICPTQNISPSINSYLIDVNMLQSPQNLKNDNSPLPTEILPKSILSSTLPVDFLNSDLIQLTNCNIPCYDLSKSQTVIPCSDISTNVVDISKGVNEISSKTLVSPNPCIESLLQCTNSINSPSSPNSNSVLSLSEFLDRITPQTSTSNIFSTNPNTVLPSSNLITENVNTFLDSSIKSDSSIQSTCFTPPFSSSVLPSLSLSQPLSSLNLVASENLITPLTSQCDNAALTSNLASCGLLPDIQKTDNYPINLNPLQCNTNIPPTNYYEKANTFCNPCCSSFTSTLTDSKLLSILNNNFLRSLEMPSLPINQNSSISKYFSDVRAVTSKLNDFISSFSNRLEEANASLSFSNILLSKVPKVDQLSNEKEITITSPNITLSDDISGAIVPLQDKTDIAPKIPQSIVSGYQYPMLPIQMAPVNYNNFQNSITSLDYSNFIPYCYNTLPYSVPTNAFAQGTFDKMPFATLKPFGLYENSNLGATTISSITSNPYTIFESFDSVPFQISKQFALDENCNALVATCPSLSGAISTLSVISDLNNSDIIIKPNNSPVTKSLTSLPKNPLPYISSINTNNSPICTPASEVSNGFSQNLSLLDLSFTENDVLEDSQMDKCCKNLKRMIDLLELSMSMNDVNYNSCPISNVLTAPEIL